MIRFYRARDCEGCKAIEDSLREMSVGFEVEIVESADREVAGLPKGARPPVLVDGEEVVQGFDRILGHLEEIEGFAREWRKFQSDACYCGDESTGPEGEPASGPSKAV